MNRPHQDLGAWKEAMRMETQFMISADLGYLPGDHDIFAQLERVAQLLGGLHRKVSR